MDFTVAPQIIYVVIEDYKCSGEIYVLVKVNVGVVCIYWEVCVDDGMCV